MHGLIAWFARNSVAANLLMIAIFGMGFYAIYVKLILEVFPSFEREIITISVAYPGASPNEVETGVVLRVEEAISDLEGIKHIFSNARESSALINVEVGDVSMLKITSEIKNRVDSISTFPDDVQKPIISQLQRKRETISVVLSGALTEKQLYEMALDIREDITHLPNISQADIAGLRPYEISIEISEATLKQYGLTLGSVSKAISASSRDIPAGTLKTSGGELRLRVLGQAYDRKQFERIVIASDATGKRIRLGDIARVNDGFTEDPLYAVFDGEKAALIPVYRVGMQSTLEVSESVKNYIEEKAATLPNGVHLTFWKDRSRIVKARLNTLLKSALQGGILIILLLALFLRPAIAFWVSVGIPISFMGALGVMAFFNISINLITLFAFIVVLGIVVDDAIVTAENIYTHQKRGKDPLQAVIDGTNEIAVPVTFGVLTTIAAFVPLLMLAGNRGKIFAFIPMVVIPVLLFSLIESKLILPTHLRHLKPIPKKGPINPLLKLQQKVANGLEVFIDKVYRPVLNVALNMRYLTIALFVVMLLISAVLIKSGHFRYTFFPRVQSEYANATLFMPAGTPINITSKHIDHINQQAEKLQQKYIDPISNTSIVQHILVTYGSTGTGLARTSKGQSHIGQVQLEITPPEKRSLTISSSELVREWRKNIGEIPGKQELKFRAEIAHGGSPIDIQLYGQDFDKLAAAAAAIKQRITAEYSDNGIFNIKNSFDGGKQELQIKLHEDADLLGISLNDLGTQIRHAFYGAEAQRIQRNRDDIYVMVRYPKAERASINDLNKMHIRTTNGVEVPLSEAAEIETEQGIPVITRVDRQRVINVTADLNKEKGNAKIILNDIKSWLPDLLTQHPGIRSSFEGEEKEQKEFMQSMITGLVFVLFAIYALLAIPFRSYVQPLIVMTVIPFSLIGALIGHAIMDMTLSISSLLGLLALTGVVVNDSLVMVDYINRRRREGIAMAKAVRAAGKARFRPILLTSLTTFFGLTPLILEKSTQAQFLIPMAVSLGFGILFATFMTLILIPASYMVLEDLKKLMKAGSNYPKKHS